MTDPSQNYDERRHATDRMNLDDTTYFGQYDDLDFVYAKLKLVF